MKLLPRQARERLERNLKSLASYCQRPADRLAKIDEEAEDPIGEWLEKRRVLWPSRELLQEIDDDVIVLAMRGRVQPILPVWKAFEQVNKRIKQLRLKARVNDLIRRACARLAGESVLGRAARDLEAGKAEAQCLLRDILLGNRDLGELLDDDRQRVLQKVKSYPLAEWAIVNGHPMAKDFGRVAEFFVLDNEAIKKRKILQRRDKTRERVQRHRLGKKTRRKSVTRSNDYTSESSST
jgi:hypothetical protein